MDAEINKSVRRRVMSVLITFAIVVAGLISITIIGAVISHYIVYTPPFKGDDGQKLPKSIAEFKHIELGGYSQAILIRGKNTDNPVLLFLHAGPGMSETGMFRNMNAILEDYYTVVYLDQRGGGKSYSPFMDYKTLNTEQLTQDIHELTLYLKERFAKEKIVLMGHSFGAGFGALATARYPDDYSAFIGIGQPVNPIENDSLSYKYVLDKARNEGNLQAAGELESVDGYWLSRDPKIFFSGMMVLKNKWLPYYGGQIYGEKSILPYVLKNSICSEFTFFDYVPYLMGVSKSGPASWDIMITTDLRKQAPEFQCPFIIMEGRQDFNVFPTLVEEYFDMVKAPVKQIYWFERSAHFPHFEEKELFQKIMINEILPQVNGEEFN